jgi:hypothetical protein
MTDEQKQALLKYTALVRKRYGSRLVDVVEIDRRVIDDPDAPLEVSLAVVVEDGDWAARDEQGWLAGETFFPLVEAGIQIRATPIARSAWDNPDLHNNPREVRRMRRDARPLEHAA